MEKCNRCYRNASLPFYVVRDGKLEVLCFACACTRAGLARESRATIVTG